MKHLSIIIVNYNVRHFLEQALLSVQRAIATLDAEVFVVDNNSVDGSVAMIYEKFPEVKVIANRQNLGFSKANNLAIRQAEGKYVLLLNPDTVVEEDTFTSIIEFMDQTPDAGALGVKMYNGEGQFLPESKRALPTPWVAFYKIFGLSRLFPKSKKFGKYHLTYLDPDKIHRIEVLSGAFMFLRKSVLDEIGYLDEDFFMYGEDIDLSYRVIQAGYHNYYFPHTKIIHYKGESTRKGSLNYVLVFYDAMRIFAEKHFGGGGKYTFYLNLIRMAIYLRAGVSIVRRITEKIAYPIAEGVMFLAATLGIKSLWENFIKYPEGNEGYSALFDTAVAPGYAAVFVLYLYLLGEYKRPFKIRNIFTAIFSGFITIATVSFIFKDINFSRAIVMMASGSALLISLFSRATLNYVRSGNFFLDEKARKRVVVVGDETEAERVINLIDYKFFYNCSIAGIVTPEGTPGTGTFPVLGEGSQLEEIVRFYGIDEIIFCNKSLPTQEIIEHMSRTAQTASGVEFKIVPNSADYLIGPSVILNASGVQPRLSNLQKKEYRLRKKLFDFAMSISLILTFPLTFWMYRHPIRALTNLWMVLKGNYHLVGYIDGSQPDLPKLKESLLNMKALAGQKRKKSAFSRQEAIRLDHVYARHYTTMLDLEIVLSGFRNLGERGLQ